MMTQFNVLIVEDNLPFKKILPKLVREVLINFQYGRNVKLIESAAEAIEILVPEYSWHLLITDIGLGKTRMEAQKKSGLQLLQIANSLNIPAVAVSGSIKLKPGDERDILKRYQAIDFFAKEDLDHTKFKRLVTDILGPRKMLFDIISRSDGSANTSILNRVSSKQIEYAAQDLRNYQKDHIKEKDLFKIVESISDLLSLTSNSSEQLDQGNFILQGRDSIIKIIEDPELNSNHKLKIILPIIPVFVTYFGEIELRGGINLKNLWRKIFKKNN